jgi:FMN phosphatase YigB (HAD superfamily)
MAGIALVDFGNTLVDETWMRRNSDRFPTWTVDYVAVVDEMHVAWETGRITSRDIAEAVAPRLGTTARAVHDNMLELCRSLTFFPVINSALARRRARGGRQALVTVNVDLFAAVAELYSLHDLFDVIVNSADHGTVDKVSLCHRALALLGGCDPADTVLIDNIEPNVTAWTAAGGHAYLYRDDPTFTTDVLTAQVPSFLPADLS